MKYSGAIVAKNNLTTAFGSYKNLRQFNLAGARVGFNSKENDNEVKGTGNSVDFGARVFDSRISRWMSIDQRAAKYPYISPYSFAANSPLMFIDMDGKDIYYVVQNSKTNKPELVKADLDYMSQVLNSTKAGHELLAQYANNPKKDLYITIGKTSQSDALGQHTAGNVLQNNNTGELTREQPVKKNSNGVLEYNGVDDNFNGTEIYDDKRENHFVTLNEDVFKSGFLGMSKKLASLGAKVLGHEIGAHAEGKIGDSQTEQHNEWGQGELETNNVRTQGGDFTIYSSGTGKAKELNEQVDKVGVTKKESVSSSKVANKGGVTAYKVNIK